MYLLKYIDTIICRVMLYDSILILVSIISKNTILPVGLTIYSYNKCIIINKHTKYKMQIIICLETSKSGV